jgi:hypothetical protein
MHQHTRITVAASEAHKMNKQAHTREGGGKKKEYEEWGRGQENLRAELLRVLLSARFDPLEAVSGEGQGARGGGAQKVAAKEV